MQHSQLVRLTIQIEGFPCNQLYKHTNGSLWWDLDYMHVALVEKGAPKHKYHWLSSVKSTFNDDEIPFLADGAHLHTARCDAPANLCNANICTSLALLTFLWRTVDIARLQPILDACCGYLLVMAARACEVLPILDGGRIQLPQGHSLTILRNGTVSGFWDVALAFHCNLCEAWLAMWAVMRGLGLLEADAAHGGDASFRDIIVFVSMFKRTRRRKKQAVVSPLAARLLHELSVALVSWLSVHFDKFVLDVFVPNNVEAVDRPPPALRHRNKLAGDDTRKYVAVSPEAVWSLIEKSNAAGVSLHGAIKLKSDEGTLGCTAGRCDLWTNKLLQMYSDRASLGFLHVKHYNIVSDGATHSCHETLVTLGYTWENDIGV